MTAGKRTLLDQEMTDLQTGILRQASMVDQAIERAFQALMERNSALAQEVVAADAQINRLRLEVEEKALLALATQQPAARDLRQIIASIHLTTELERIGDHAAGIAQIVTRLEGQPLAFDLTRLPKMVKRARDMLSQAVGAYANRDVEQAWAIVQRDRKLDKHYRKLFLEAMGQFADPANAEPATYMLWIGHNLERIGDRATNIAERVIFMVTAQFTEVMEEYE